MARFRAIRSGYALPEYVREISARYFDLRMLRVRVSELRPENRDKDSLWAIEEALSPLSLEGLARIFRLPEGDYLLTFAEAETDRVRAALVGLRFVLPDDPLSPQFGAEAGRDTALLSWRDLKDGFDDLRALADRYETDAIAHAEAAARREGSRSGAAKGDAAKVLAEEEEAAHDAEMPPSAGDGGDPGGREKAASATIDSARMDWHPMAPGPDRSAPANGGESWVARPWSSGRPGGGRQPIDPDVLDRLENGLEQADLSSHVRWQRVCAIVGSAPPRPVFTEIFVSIPELRETIAPRIDLTSNRWLFQHFTETLDRRVLSYLNREGVRVSRDGLSINLNVQTILSETFLRFEEVVAAGTHGTVVLELRLEDVFADMEAYVFARDYVRQRGYRLCIDALDVESLMLVDRERLGADLVKLFWDPDLPSRMITKEGIALAQRLRAGEGARTVLARCESGQAVTLGQELGIAMFQGRHVDDLLGILDTSVSVPKQPRR